MIHCPSCGEENPPKFRLCGYCGTALAAQAAAPATPREVRKTVTLIFSDLKGSTALGERLDSEALHEVKERYFKAMVAAIEQHGGKIEKYIGDAIMAVFGLPRAHEDDALRAVRAAVGMRSALERVNQDLMRQYGVALAARTGVNTGEVVANTAPGADQKLATGDAVNVAARLEQAASENEIYVGAATWALVRDAVQAESVAPLELKGKAERVAAYRLLSVPGVEGYARRVDTPLVGRQAELAQLRQAHAQARDTRRAHLVTVIGDAGVGKSRLVVEMVDRIAGDAQVVRGRCLPYGDGITFWPLVTMVREAAAIVAEDTPEAARAKVLGLVGDREVADRLAAATGLSADAFALRELTWAARKFLELLAAHGPVVAVVDDIHWAEPAFLELLEHVVDAAGDAPLLLLATARHELLEEHPQWGQSQRSTRLVLPPLNDDAATRVALNLLGSADLEPGVVQRIVKAAEGNPLYVEQMLSMLVDGGALKLIDGRWVRGSALADIAVPPTIHALLEARLDSLSRDERSTVEPASVVGLEFPRPAIAALSQASDPTAVDARLSALCDKRFIHPHADANEAGDDPLYRFHHQLVRDTVYNGLLKRTRATMHIDLVRWADKVHSERGRALEYQEILGYHLEQAHHYLRELGPLDEAGLAVGADAARRLGDAGGRAFARADMRAAANLFRRATALLPPTHARRLALLPMLGEALMETGDFAGARAVIDEAEAAAQASADIRLGAAARLGRMFVRLYSGEPGEWGAPALQVAAEAIAALEPLAAHNELAIAWRLTAFVHGVSGRYLQADAATVHYMRHARAAGNQRLVARSSLGLANGLLPGPTPALEGIARCEALLDDVRNDRQVHGYILCILAQLRAMNGDFELARALVDEGRAALRDLGKGVNAASSGIDLARVELLAGDLARAERELRADLEFLRSAGESYLLSTVAAVLARVLRAQGRDADALELSRTAEAAAAEDDVDAQVQWRSVRAPVLARHGDAAQAERLAREALELALNADAPLLQAEAHADLAEVLMLARRTDEAAREYGAAAALWSTKGDLVSAARARRAAAA